MTSCLRVIKFLGGTKKGLELMAENEKRTASEQVKFRVTPVEKERLEFYASANKMSVPEMAKHLSLQQAKNNTVLTNFTSEQYMTLRQDIKRIGTNLNQLTKKINTKEREKKLAEKNNPLADLFPSRKNNNGFDQSDKELLESLKKEVEKLWAHL